MRQQVTAGTAAHLPLSMPVEASNPDQAFDCSQAISEGWMILQSTNRHQSWQLQRVDNARTFGTDVEAWCFVFDRAEQGSTYHQRAIEFLAQQQLGRPVV